MADLRGLLQDLKKKITHGAEYFNPTSNAGNNFWSSRAASALADVQQSNPLSIFSGAGRQFYDTSSKFLQKTPQSVPYSPAYKTVGRFGEQFFGSAGEGVGSAQSGLGMASRGMGKIMTGDPLGGYSDIARGVTRTALGTGRLMAQTNPFVYGSKIAASLPGAENVNLPPWVPVVGGANVPRGAASMIEFVKNPAWGAIFPVTSKLLAVPKTGSAIINFFAGSGMKGGIEGLIQGVADLPDGLSQKEQIGFLAQNVGFGAGSEVFFNSLLSKGLLKAIKGDIDGLKKTYGNRAVNLPYGEGSVPAWRYMLYQKFGIPYGPLQKGAIDPNYKFGEGTQATKGVTTKIQTPQLDTQTETPVQKPKDLPDLSTPPKPSLEPQTNRKRVVRIRSTQPLDDIIQQGRNQIGETAPKPNQSTKQALDDLYTQWVDRYNPLVKASQQAKKTLKIKGAELRPEYDPEYLVRRLTGAGGIADYRFKTELNPILKQMEQAQIPKVDMDVYLANKRIAGFGQVGRDIKGADPVKAGQIVSALEGKYAGIKEIADQMYQFQNRGFQEMIDAGFISPEVGATIRSQNPDYAPLYRVMDEVDNYLGIPTRKTMQGSQPILKIKGSERKIESPIESIIGNIFRQRAAIEKNRVAKSIVGLQEIAPDLGFKKVGQAGTDTITIWNQGKKEYWQVGQEIADVAKGANEEAMNMVLKIIRAPAALLRQAATGRNPEFMIPNIVRDQLDAGVTSRYGYIPFVDYVSGLKSMLTNDEIYQKWQNSGAKIALGELSGKKSVQQLFDEKKAGRGLFGWLSAGLDVMGQYSEQPTRVGLFKRAYQNTGNELMAMMESRDATVDFARMGSKMKVANSIIPFLNVGVQGFDKLVRAVKNNPPKVLLTMGAYAAAPQIMSTIYNLVNHPDEYGDIPEYEKQSNFVLVGGRNGDGTVDYVTIPKGNVVPVVANPIQSFLEYAFKYDKASFKEMALNVLSETLPVLGAGSSLKEIGIKTVGSNLPQAIKPITENLLNKSFYKYDTKKEQTRDIVPSYLQNKPPYEQSYEFTPEMYKKIGAIFNVSPLQVQNLMEGYFAGYTKIPSQLIQVLTKASDNQPISPNDRTILRRFIKQTYPGSSTPAPAKPESPGLFERVFGTASAAESSATVPKMTKYSDGSVRIMIGGESKQFDNEEEALLGLEKYNFKKSDKNIEEYGDLVLRKTKDGNVTTMSKLEYDTNLNTQKMENAKKSKDYKAWLGLAEKQLEYYQKQAQDPTLDELDKIELQQKVDSLIAEYDKYSGYGGLTKPKKAKKISIRLPSTKVNAIKISRPKLKALKITKPNIVKKSKKETPIVKISQPKLKSMNLKKGIRVV